MSGKNRSKAGIDVVEKIISLKEVDQEFLTNKTILAYLGGVSKEYIKDLRESGVLPYYKVRNTIFYKVSDVRKMVPYRLLMTLLFLAFLMAVMMMLKFCYPNRIV